MPNASPTLHERKEEEDGDFTEAKTTAIGHKEQSAKEERRDDADDEVEMPPKIRIGVLTAGPDTAISEHVITLGVSLIKELLWSEPAVSPSLTVLLFTFGGLGVGVGWHRASSRSRVPGYSTLTCSTTGLNSLTVRFQRRAACGQPPCTPAERW